MRLDLLEPLPKRVEQQYEQAKRNESLIYSETELATIRTGDGIPFQLRYCPALAKKPQKDEKPKLLTKKPDPFINPHEDLFVASVLDPSTASHILLLNKYPVIAQHFILATKADKPQTDLLEQTDLEAAYLCLTEWERHGDGKRLFGFFNSGQHSGASQPHRHLQFLPIESMRRGDADAEWELLMDFVSSKPDASLPFVWFAKSLPVEPTAQQLHETYTELLAKAVVAVRSASGSDQGEPVRQHADGGAGAAPISYNLAMTTASMAVVPRSGEGVVLHDQGGKEVGYVALNGTILGGTLMVKFQEEWDVLRGDTRALDHVLQNIGIPKKSPGNDGTVRL